MPSGGRFIVSTILKKKITVVTVGHPRFDTRIWVKEIATLIAAGYEVAYCVADGAGDELRDGVQIKDFGHVVEGGGVWHRVHIMARVAVHCGFRKDAWLQFHDGIFLPFALLLAAFGRHVIYDVHEDYPLQVLNKRFPMWLKRIWSACMSGMERLGCYLFVGFVVATPTIAKRFPDSKTICVSNFPRLEEFADFSCRKVFSKPTEPAGIYIGMLAEVRGLLEMVDAMAQVGDSSTMRLRFGGRFSPPSLVGHASCRAGWERVDFLGWLDRDQVVAELAIAHFGLVVLHPTTNYIDAYPVKLFEYMAAGIPVIASDFPLWRDIVASADCGLLVDPLDPRAIADAMQKIAGDDDAAAAMGMRGREAVETRYNWTNEGIKLVETFKRWGVGTK